ncbi:hypothetical protein F5I97DRAFT_1791528, partial [Phlebopus sp. FC_14]
SLNRVVLLRFDGGRKAIARSLAGAFSLHDRERARHHRRRLGLPIPLVLAWSSRAEGTDVGAEFILMEKAPGCILYAVWGNLIINERARFVKTLAEWECQLLELKFTHYGSLYYKGDVPAVLRAPTLLEDISPGDELNSPFCAGLTVRRDFWEAKRGSMDIQGP